MDYNHSSTSEWSEEVASLLKRTSDLLNQATVILVVKDDDVYSFSKTTREYSNKLASSKSFGLSKDCVIGAGQIWKATIPKYI